MSLFSLDELLFFVYAYTFCIKLIFLAFEGFIFLLYLPVAMYFEYNKARCIELREIKTGSCYLFEPIGKPISEVHQIFNDTDTSFEMFSPVVVDLFAIAELEDLSSEPNVACCPWATVITVGSNTMCICVYCETDDDSLSEADTSSAIDKDDCLVSSVADSAVTVSDGTNTVNTVVVGGIATVGYHDNKAPDIVSETSEVFTSESIDTKSGLPDPGLSGEGDYALGDIGISLAAACDTSSDNMDTDIPSLEESNPFVLPCVSMVEPYANHYEVNTTSNTTNIVDFGDGFLPLYYNISTYIGTYVNTSSLLTSGGGACAVVYGRKKILPKKLGVLSSSGRVSKRVPLGKKSRRVARVFGGVCFPGIPIVSIKPGCIPSLRLKADEDKNKNNFIQAEVKEVQEDKEVKGVIEVKEVKEIKKVQEFQEERNLLEADNVEATIERSRIEAEVKEPVVDSGVSACSSVIVDKPEKTKKRKNIVENNFSFIPACSVSETESTPDVTLHNPFGLSSIVLSSSKTFGKGRDLSEELKSLKKVVVAPAVKTVSYTKLSLDDPFGSSPIDSLYARTLEAKKKIYDDKGPREEKGKRPERLFVPDNKKEDRKILKPKGRRN